MIPSVWRIPLCFYTLYASALVSPMCPVVCSSYIYMHYLTLVSGNVISFSRCSPRQFVSPPVNADTKHRTRADSALRVTTSSLSFPSLITVYVLLWGVY